MLGFKQIKKIFDINIVTFLLNDGVVYWEGIERSILTHSTIEVEYIVAFEAINLGGYFYLIIPILVY